MIAGGWMERLWVEIDDHYSGKFLAQFDDQDRAKESWKRAIIRKLPLDDKQRAVKALRKAVDMIPQECAYPPLLADLLGLIDQALADTRREANLEQRYPAIAKRTDNPLLNVLAHVAQHAEKSKTATEETENIKRLLKGESVEAVTGRTLAQHRERVERHALQVSERNCNEILLRQRLYADAQG